MDSYRHKRKRPDLDRRKLLATATATAGGLAIAGASWPFIESMWPSASARARGAPVTVDTKALVPGQLATVAWRGKPVWVLRRTRAMIESLDSDIGLLVDPDSDVASQQPEYARNEWRAIRPEMFVCIGLCTHLGCVPNYFPERASVEKDWPGGFLCPRHGSKFDLAGRVFKDVPAPTNLVIPPYHLARDDSVVIGVE